ncbi:fungal-specific transcription factor domain-containing protein, partial [Plectosphaerella plurivora]
MYSRLTQSRCQACRNRKVKCSGAQPCRYCIKRRQQCIFPDNVRKKRYAVDYVEGLEALARRSSGGIRSAEASRDDEMPLPGGETDSEGAIIPETVNSSSVHFSNQIESLPSLQRPPTASTTADETLISDDVYRIHRPPLAVMPSEPEWPSPSQAHQLLDTHLFDPRTISDRLSLAFELPVSHDGWDSIHRLQLLMVFALGQLLGGELQAGEALPGIGFFHQVESRLPRLSVLRDLGLVAVETLGLMAFYLQCADRRDDAYVHAGFALRLAISHGLARTTDSALSRSEAAHRNRLWWTIYMQERRLASATGNPVSIQDDAIATPPPTETPGFTSPTALNMNVKLARLTGQTMETIYSHKSRSVSWYIRSVKVILGRLSRVATSIPSKYSVDFAKPIVPSRTSATLHLMLYQNIILVTRPTLLHLAKIKLAAESDAASRMDTSLFANLSEACTEAASRSLDLLLAMIKQRIIANFGFFDLDATFSAAFVFVLIERIYPSSTNGNGVANIQRASEIMQYLASRGNKAAAKRHADLERICSHIGLSVGGG